MQRLPLPVGSPHPVRAAPSRGRRLPSGRGAIAVLGVLAAAAGAALGAVQPAVTVGLDASAYRVGDVTLPARGGGVYAGPGGAVVVDGSRAAAATSLHGVRMRGSCLLAADGRTERCTFDLDGRAVTAQDRLAGGGWDRRYSDGSSVRIELSGGRPVPVPIALGE